MTYDMNRPFNLRHNGSMTDAVAASREEFELEALVSVVGGPQAQRAILVHQLPELVAGLARRTY